MKVLEKGHIYQPNNRGKITGATMECLEQKITFINKEPGSEHPGTTTQEVIRILLDRTRHCNNCLPHPNNERVIYHLRMALGLHEARALERKIEKGDIIPEYVQTGTDGHFDLHQTEPGKLHTPELVGYRHDWDRACNHPKKSA